MHGYSRVLCVRACGYSRVLCVRACGYSRVLCVRACGYSRVLCVRVCGYSRVLCVRACGYSRGTTRNSRVSTRELLVGGTVRVILIDFATLWFANNVEGKYHVTANFVAM